MNISNVPEIIRTSYGSISAVVYKVMGFIFGNIARLVFMYQKPYFANIPSFLRHLWELFGRENFYFSVHHKIKFILHDRIKVLDEFLTCTHTHTHTCREFRGM